MKRMIAISAASVLVWVVMFFADQARGKRLEAYDNDPVSWVNSAGFGLVFGIAAWVGLAVLLYGLPLLWNGILSGTRQFSRAVRDK